MSYQVLARKYRPQSFADVIGQDHVTQTLRHAIEQQRIAQGYIFSGHRGIGKTTVARILAMALNCRAGEAPTPEPCGKCDSCMEIRAGNAVDVVEIDAATNRGIDEIRELREAVRYRPARDRYRIYILDEAHQITDAACIALLKTLEEPPSHVVFMMATTQPEEIPQTIRSRCQHFSFHAVRFDDIVGQLREIARAEGIAADDAALALLAEAGDGSMRDALSILDQAMASTSGGLTAELVRGLVGAVPSETLEQIMQAVERNSSEEALRLLDRLLSEGQNPAHFTRQMVRFLRNAVVAKVAGADSSLLQTSADERERVRRVADLFSEEDLARFLQILLRTHGELFYKREQRFHLELGVLKMVHAQRLLPLEELLSGEEEASASTVAAARGGGKPSVSAAREAAAPQPSAPPPTSAARRPSPFAADKARKGGQPEPEMSAAAAVAVAESAEAESLASPEPIAGLVVTALEEAGQRMLAAMLEGGEWSATASKEITVRVAESPKMVEMAMGVEARRLLNAAASRAAGRATTVRVVGDGVNGAPPAAPRQPARQRAGTSQARATDDPVVRRMQEKFGAEIRSVIDHKEKPR
ncbi:MAG: DNA polymerase III subunit gamma/tau [Terriglobales bacterium]